MNNFPEGNAIVYCEGAFNTPNGKTAHGLVRRTLRYNILSVIDSCYASKDAGLILDEKVKNIQIYEDIPSAVNAASISGRTATHMVVGIAPDGGRLSPEAKKDVKIAIDSGLNIDSGLHDFLTEDAEISSLAAKRNVKIRDIRKTPSRNELHFFNGKIEQVTSLKIALLGTDSAVGKRTTAWIIVDSLNASGFNAQFVGTGQTAWMQGAQYCIILDSLINDFVAGEIEHAVWSAWKENNPDFIIIEGQGSLMNPAYPGGFEILAAGRTDVVILQHAPARKEYDGFPGYEIHSLDKQIRAIELISGKPVIAITINHENIERTMVMEICNVIEKETGLPTCDVLYNLPDKIISEILKTSNHNYNKG